MLRNYEVPDRFYPMGELESMESLQLELNETRNQMFNHRKRFARKWVYAREMFDDEGVKALSSDVDNTMVPILGDANPANYIAPLPSIGTPPDFYNQSGLIEEDINSVTGISDYMRGQPESDIRRTATEAAMIQDAANSRARDKLAKVETFLAEVGEAIVALMQQFLTGDHVARITSVAGRAWVNYDADYLQGSYDFEVEGGSTEPRNESFRRMSALQLVDAMAPFVGAGVVNPAGLARYVLQYGFGIKDVSQILNGPAEAQQQQAQMNPEIAGELPPGQGPMPPEGMPAEAVPAEAIPSAPLGPVPTGPPMQGLETLAASPTVTSVELLTQSAEVVEWLAARHRATGRTQPWTTLSTRGTALTSTPIRQAGQPSQDRSPTNNPHRRGTTSKSTTSPTATCASKSTEPTSKFHSGKHWPGTAGQPTTPARHRH